MSSVIKRIILVHITTPDLTLHFLSIFLATPPYYASGVLSQCFSNSVEGPVAFVCFISNPQWWSTWSYYIRLGHCSYDM